jgi:hypothetical protein
MLGEVPMPPACLLGGREFVAVERRRLVDAFAESSRLGPRGSVV